jgi:hypothetical protein
MNPRAAVKAGAAPASMRKPCYRESSAVITIFQSGACFFAMWRQNEAMKLTLPFLFLSALFAFASNVHAQTAAVSVRVEQETKQEEPNLKDHFTKTQKRTLKVFLTNSAKEDTNVKIKFAYFGHPIASHEVTKISEGEKEDTLKPSETKEVDTPTNSQTYTEEHYPPGKGANKVKIPASGNKLTGYGVQVYVGEKLMGESYEPLSMKEQMDKAPAASVAAPPKKK